MQTRWVNRNVALNVLSKRIEDFYKRKGFETSVDHLEDTYKIVAALRIDDKLRTSYVSVKGNSNDFTVEFLGGRSGRFSLLLAPLATMFGGGIFILDRLKSQDFYERLETEFWAFVENVVEQLPAPKANV